MRALLQESRYFLHTVVNEPFGLTAVQAMAAGCLPIVHDSGGQRETVPNPRLRYRTLDEAPDMIRFLEALDTTTFESLTTQLQQHVALSYDEAIFHRKMRDILTPHIRLLDESWD